MEGRDYQGGRTTGCCKRNVPLFENFRSSAARQLSQPMHSQSANFGKFKISSLNLAPFLLLNPVCYCMRRVCVYVMQCRARGTVNALEKNVEHNELEAGRPEVKVNLCCFQSDSTQEGTKKAVWTLESPERGCGLLKNGFLITPEGNGNRNPILAGDGKCPFSPYLSKIAHEVALPRELDESAILENTSQAIYLQFSKLL